MFDFLCSTFFFVLFFFFRLIAGLLPPGTYFVLFFGQEGGRQETFLFYLFIRALFEAPISERLAFCTDRLLCYFFLPTKGKEALKVGQGPRSEYGSKGHRSCCLPARWQQADLIIGDHGPRREGVGRLSGEAKRPRLEVCAYTPYTEQTDA